MPTPQQAGAELVGALLGRCSFPAPGTPLVCAVSGGADSLALLALAVHAGLDATAVHVDHGLRAASAAEADVVAGAAAALGAHFRAERVELVPGSNLEARARAARRAVLPPAHATGHTMDDQAETVLVNLLRGAGSDGLAGMRRGPSHPILGLRRTDTRAVCEALGFDPVRDPTNDDTAFVRNRVRHELLPLACAIAGRDLVPILARQAELFADEARLLDELAAGLDPSDAASLRDAPRPLARRAVRSWLRDGGPYPPDLAAVERVLAVAQGNAVATEVAPGRGVRRSRGVLTIAEVGDPGEQDDPPATARRPVARAGSGSVAAR
ncbi:MAG TPA: tRNA lysidine(34) synthetase TilS [Acidimicrobiales bacterium]|nr:tRNA lysidine(34) synthetase TilS [Acidimicrobiales bacterium]